MMPMMMTRGAASPTPSPATINTGKLFRTFQVRKETINEESRTVELSFSSETPVPRWFGNEILDHGPKAMRLGRLKAGGPFLMDHDPYDHRGVIETITISDKRGVATVRLSKSVRGEELWQDIRDGIRTNISVGYFIHAMRLESEKDGIKTYRATDWEPYEISSVAMPADLSVGIGRAEDKDFPHETSLETPTEENRTMEKCPHCQRDLVAGACTCEGYRAANPPAGVRTATVPGSGFSETDVVANERSRVKQIEDLASRFPQLSGIGELARDFRNNGRSADEFQTALLQRLGQPAATTAEPIADLLNAREDKEYSVRNAILCALGERTSGIETDVHQHIEKKLGRGSAGIFIPLSLKSRGQRTAVAGAVSTLAAASGGGMVDTQLMPLIEILRSKMMTRALGARVLSGLVGNLSFPKQVASAVLYWMAENSGTDVTESDLSAFLGSIALGPKSAQATTAVTRQMLAQGSEDIEMLIRDDLAAVNALGLDFAAIAGTGSNNQPRGILNTTGIGSVVGGTDGAAPAWSHIVDLETEVSVDNADIGTLAYLTNAKVRGKLKQTPKVAGQDTFIWGNGTGGFGELNGYRAAASNQVPSNLTKGGANAVCSGIIYGNWNDLMIGEWGVLEIIADPYTLKKQGLIELTSFMMADVAIRRAESFAAMKDALTD